MWTVSLFNLYYLLKNKECYRHLSIFFIYKNVECCYSIQIKKKMWIVLIISTAVNNVGVATDLPNKFLEVSEKSVWSYLNVNTATVPAMTRLVLPAMVARGRGAIVNISSMASLCPCPLLSIYSASKVGSWGTGVYLGTFLILREPLLFVLSFYVIVRFQIKPCEQQVRLDTGNCITRI